MPEELDMMEEEMPGGEVFEEEAAVEEAPAAPVESVGSIQVSIQDVPMLRDMAIGETITFTIDDTGDGNIFTLSPVVEEMLPPAPTPTGGMAGGAITETFM